MRDPAVSLELQTPESKKKKLQGETKMERNEEIAIEGSHHTDKNFCISGSSFTDSQALEGLKCVYFSVKC